VGARTDVVEQSSSFCPSLDATCASNAWLRCASGSRASRISITTSALSSTAARSGRSGLRSSGALLTSVVEAGAEEDIPFVAGMRLVDLDGLFVASQHRQNRLPLPRQPREPASLPSFPPASKVTFCCARSFFFSIRRAFASVVCRWQPAFLSLEGLCMTVIKGAPVFVPLLSVLQWLLWPQRWKSELSSLQSRHK
jgi:hypothetical protein